tara:strand:- start:125 stop:643 length:519 start_codon:yes stop_codon:yes gene_type:complete
MKQPKNKTISSVAKIVNTIVTEVDKLYQAEILQKYDDPSATLVGSMIESCQYLITRDDKKNTTSYISARADEAYNLYERELRDKSEQNVDPKFAGPKRFENIALAEAVELVEGGNGDVADRKRIANSNLEAIKMLQQDLFECYQAMFDREYILADERKSSTSSKRPSRKMIA